MNNENTTIESAIESYKFGFNIHMMEINMLFYLEQSVIIVVIILNMRKWIIIVLNADMKKKEYNHDARKMSVLFKF